jgi:hypothetical protein
MLHKVLSQLVSFSTNLVNNSLVKHGNNGAKLTITLVLKTVKFVSRFFNSIENHIMEGSFPDSIPTFTPHDMNPKLLQAVNVVAPINKIAALKVKPVACLQELPLMNVPPKSSKSKLPLDPRTSQKQEYFIARKGLQSENCFPATSGRIIILPFVSMVRNAQSPIRLATLIMLGSGIRSLQTTSLKFASTSMRLKGRFG